MTNFIQNQEPKQAEFLVKSDSGYVLQVLDENAGGEGVVRVPNGAESFNQLNDEDNLFFLKKENEETMFSNAKTEWFWEDWGGFDLDGVACLWQRETLNDQVASAEKYRQEEVLPMLDRFPSEQEIKSEGLNRGDVNYRVAKAFNEIRGTDLNEDDIDYLRKFIDLTNSHYGV